MDKEQRQRIKEALDEAARAAGSPDWNTAMAGLARVAEWFIANQQQLTVEGLISLMDGADSATALEPWIGVFENFGLVARSLLMEIAERARKSLPSPPGGRPRALTAETSAAVICYVGDLNTKGVSLADAFNRTARHFGLRPSTVERAWRGRKRAAPVAFDLGAAVMKILVPPDADMTGRHNHRT